LLRLSSKDSERIRRPGRVTSARDGALERGDGGSSRNRLISINRMRRQPSELRFHADDKPVAILLQIAK
jgi:hypothetical protein